MEAVLAEKQTIAKKKKKMLWSNRLEIFFFKNIQEA